MRLSTGQVEGGMRRLPERFADRIPEAELREVIYWRDAGEWDQTLADLIAALHRHRATISDREARSLRDYLETFGPVLSQGSAGLEVLETATRSLDELRVIPSLTDEQMRERLRTFAERFRGRLPDETVEDLIIHPEEESEPLIWSEAADILVGELRTERVRITEQERNELWMLLDALNLSRKEWVQLPVA
jgi:hypothetical protein